MNSKKYLSTLAELNNAWKILALDAQKALTQFPDNPENFHKAAQATATFACLTVASELVATGKTVPPRLLTDLFSYAKITNQQTGPRNTFTIPEAIGKGMKFGLHGIYLGTIDPKDDKKRPYGKKYHVFASTHDVPVSMPAPMPGNNNQNLFIHIDDVFRRIGCMRNWRFHEGHRAETSDLLWEDLVSRAAEGKWVVPPMGVWFGMDEAGNTYPDLKPLISLAHEDPHQLSFDHRLYPALSSKDAQPLGYAITAPPQKKSSPDIVDKVHLGEKTLSYWPRSSAKYFLCRPCRFVLV
jgi:hypothetical protein